MAELYACDGRYHAVHGETTPGCGTVFMAGAGHDDIHDGDGHAYTVKDWCPVCRIEGVVVRKKNASGVKIGGL